jgi:hypothetical protein
LSVNDLEKKLAQFLSAGIHGYTRPEIREWLSFRDGATHADLAKTTKIVLEGDIRPFIARMEQAAQDVLFNKLKWHDSSRERRCLVKHLAASTSTSGDWAMVQGIEVALQCQVFDDFGAYPSDLSGALTSPPAEWWWKIGPKQATGGEEPKPA